LRKKKINNLIKIKLLKKKIRMSLTGKKIKIILKKNWTGKNLKNKSLKALKAHPLLLKSN
jgi:hypothetical protein